nr:4113_t:CDS:2 [Entrophospora candida]
MRLDGSKPKDMNKLANAITIKSAEALAKSCSNLLDKYYKVNTRQDKNYPPFKEDEDDTPLVKIKSLSKAIGCEILGKAELLSPGGSTGIPIAMISCAKGYNAWIIIPDDQAEEKYQLLEK